jgi:hypothetical protein
MIVSHPIDMEMGASKAIYACMVNSYFGRNKSGSIDFLFYRDRVVRGKIGNLTL